MRIIRAREQAQLLSAWHRTAGWADWKVTATYPQYHPEARDEKAQLENGHHLTIGSGNWGNNRGDRWFWHVNDGEGNTLHSWSTGGGEPEYSADAAKQKAEQAYQRLFPIGTDTGKHDSGVDYSDLNKFMGEL